jgi:hypothetical protein
VVLQTEKECELVGLPPKGDFDEFHIVEAGDPIVLDGARDLPDYSKEKGLVLFLHHRDSHEASSQARSSNILE